MAIDFTKPIRFKGTHGLIKVIFQDKRSVLYELADITNDTRTLSSHYTFEKDCENVPEAPKRIKGFMLLVQYKDRKYIEGDFIMPSLDLAKAEIEKLPPSAKVLAIKEIEFTEGEGLQ